MSVLIKLRRGTASEWSSQNVILASGEPGYETDTGRLKIGNGSSTWNNLYYASIIPTGLLSGSGINISLGSNGSTATINVSGLSSNYISDFNEAVDDRIGSGLFVAGTGINLNYNDISNSFTVSVTGVSFSGHTHTSSDITDFNSSVSGLLPVKDVVAGTGISINSSSGIYTITSTGSGIIADQANQAASIVTTVFNKTASTIPKMSAVYINGGQGDQPTIQLAIATGDVTSAATYGITYEAISSMSTGKVIVLGSLSGVNTDQFNPTAPTGNVNGTIVYLSPSVSGALTTTKPYAPNHLVSLGTIVRTHQNDGVIEVRVQNGFELEELHNVVATGSINNQSLIYNSSSGLWINTTLTSSLISDFNEAVDDRIGSGLFVAGTGINLTYNDIGNSFTVSVTGLINDPTNNRILTSRDSSSTGIDAESNLTFDGTSLVVSGDASIDNIKIDGNIISSIDSNGVIIIRPTGYGSLQGDDLGDARGQYSTDWQRSRSYNDQVASANYAVIGGGDSNKVIGNNGTVAGGVSNTANYCCVVAGGSSNSANASNNGFSAIAGGYANISNSDYSFIGGGAFNTNYASYCAIAGGYTNYAYGDYGFIGGGSYNYAYTSSVVCGGSSNQAYNTSFVGGGTYNTAYGVYSVIGGGSNNTDQYSGDPGPYYNPVIAGGSYNSIRASYSAIGGGYFNKTNAQFSSIPGGQYAKTTKYGELSHANGSFYYPGDAQHVTLIARRETTDDTADIVLFLDGSSASERLTIPAETTWSFTIKISAYNTTNNEGGWWNLRGGIIRDNSGNTSLIGNIISESSVQSSLNGAVATAVADDSNDALELRVTGVSGKTIRWVAVVDISQVSFSQI